MIKYFCDLCNKEIVSEEYVEQAVFCHYDFKISCDSIICKKCWEENNAENTQSELNSPQLNEDTLRKASVIEDGIPSDSQQKQNSLNGSHDLLNSSKSVIRSQTDKGNVQEFQRDKTADTQIQNEINKDYAIEGTEVKDE